MGEESNFKREEKITELRDLGVEVERFENTVLVKFFIRDELLETLVQLIEVSEKIENS